MKRAEISVLERLLETCRDRRLILSFRLGARTVVCRDEDGVMTLSYEGARLYLARLLEHDESSGADGRAPAPNETG